ncbi:MAG: alpha/beta hydrolase, partial [Sphingomonadaceae bacterium]
MRWLALLVATFIALPAHAAGRLERFVAFPSHHVDPRNVTVWLPEDYDPKGTPHAVLYMHDGQNVLDAATAMGGEEWGMDEMLTRLIGEQIVRQTIVVAIATPKGRSREYMPRKVFDLLPPAMRRRIAAEQGGTPSSVHYLRFIVEELKPFIDRNYRTASDRDNTFIMGASMGGLISLYAVGEYPQVFGGAGCLSTHWPLFVMPEAYQTGTLDTEAVTTAFE